MRVDSLEGNTQRLDGGAMFGNCPRALWTRWVTPDDANRIPLACRAMLVRTADRTVLVEAGVGAFFPPAMRERYGVAEAEHVLLGRLAALGVAPEAVDVVVLSHLHFDHAGGVLAAHADGAPLRLAFPNAQYVVGRRAFERAERPHARDRASFVPELPGLLADSGRLELVDDDTSATLGDGWRLEYSDGHTPGLMLPTVDTPDGPVTYLADLCPGVPWLHLPITMGFDRAPEVLVDEKRTVLDRVIADGGTVVYTHDAEIAASRVARDDRGRYGAVDPVPVLSLGA